MEISEENFKFCRSEPAVYIYPNAASLIRLLLISGYETKRKKHGKRAVYGWKRKFIAPVL